jgi:glucans biosynthesis protein C
MNSTSKILSEQKHQETELKPYLTRRYDLDWIRAFAILILLFYHTGMIYSGWGWHIESKENSQTLRNWMLFSHQWRMPLLFFISGAGTFFALGLRSGRQYLWERSQKLFFPLAFGMFVIVPPQIYIERIFKSQFRGDYLSFYPSVFEFIPYPAGSFSWHHLWFVAYLFVYSCICLPLFLSLRKPKFDLFFQNLLRFFSYKGTVLILAIPIILSQFLLRPYFPEETHDLLNDWAYFTFNIFFFLYGYILCSSIEFMEILKAQRRIMLGATVFVVALMYFIYWGRFFDSSLEEVTWIEIVWNVNKILVTWFSILATLAYSYKYLNFRSPFLKYVNEGLYPFYILHQTVIIIIGFQVLKWNIGLWAGFWLISTLSLLLCVGIYIIFIRPFNLMRFCFGMKLVRKSK